MSLLIYFRVSWLYLIGKVCQLNYSFTVETRREAENSAGNKKDNLNRLADLYAVLAETTDSTQRDSINSEISRLMQDMN